jgi:hypothetical protein
MRLLRLPQTLIRIPLELGMEVAKRAAGIVGLGGGGPTETPVRVPPRPRFERRPQQPPPPARRAPAAPPEPALAPEPPEPEHVSEEPVLVAEVAEQGAEDGAGAEISVEEPWPGYDRMRAADVIDRLRVGSPAVAAAVGLYEPGHKNRRSVIEAAARGMASATS